MNMNDSNQHAGTESIVALNDYQRIARQTDQHDKNGLDGLPFFLLGLFGEVGTLLSALKKKQRDQESYLGYHDAVIEEFGDVLWYFSNIASRASLTLNVLAQKTFLGLKDWDKVKNDRLDSFEGVQLKKSSLPSASDSFEAALISLAGKVGLLLHDFDLKKFAKNRDALSGHLIDIFRAVIESANVANIDLGIAAQLNVLKINSRWPVERKYPPLFDEGFGPLECFPRKIVMRIFEETRNNKRVVIQQYNGVNIGSPIMDNRITPDDYRFHDAFHLAYAAILGWSPVLRGLLKLKRKSNPKIDEAEDGQRAILIEEGISTLIFQRAVRLNCFASLKSLDYPLLKLIPDFVNGYEVEKCPLWQWEKAILDGFTVFRKLRDHRRGIVTADLKKRSISFKELP